MTASIEKSSTQGFRKQKNKIVIRHSLKADMNLAIPDEGEVVFATDTNELLVGDGINRVQDLSPISGGDASLPEQTGHAGEFLTTDGSEVSWSATPQSDWKQTDTNASDYIKNKPFIPEGVVVDQTYDATSTNAQAGIAVAEAVGAVDTALNTHIADKNNPHEVTKEQIGLGNVDNTSDENKPISTATQTALDSKVTKNADITGATHTKITYDSKGLVTSGADLEASDIPDISATYQTKITETNKLSTDYISGLANVAKTGDYGDLTNKPTIPAAQVNSDWNAASGIAQILNKPTLSVVATSGDYNDLLNKPYIPSGVIVDQTYSPTSNNAQSGIAVAEAVANKVDANTAITGGTATKITYDSKGLVTAGSNLQASDIPDLSATYQSLLVSGTNIKTINNESILGNGNLTVDGLPSQTGQNGKFLTTDGTDASWAIVPSGGSTVTLKDWLI